jgi:hypothetical protein
MRLLKFALARLRSERGQALVLASLAMVVTLGFAAMAIDVGYWYSEKREVQKAVDAAALAGAQELPDDYVQAETVARDYLARNGITDQDTISVTFRCTSTYQQACNPAANKWDSIIVEVERPAEAWFAKVFGIQEVLISDVRAVGCHGICGGSPFQPVDVVQIIDRTGSMTAQDMVNAKNGAKALLRYFDGDIQRVGLAVLGPSTSWASPCGSALPGVWLPVHLSDDYQNPDGTLNTSSRLVSTINCLTTSSVGTDIADPLTAAVDELQANGRPDVKWGIILLTDGAANAMPSYDTGYKSPTANLAAPGGHGNGFEVNPQNAYADDSNYASDIDSGTGTSTSCGSTQKDRHDFYNYGISVPGGSSIIGIEVRLDAWIDSTSGTTTRRMCVELSWDGGAHWTAAQQIASNLSTSQGTYILGGSGDNWGHTWTPSELSDANFRVRITNVSNKSSPYIRDFYLDWAAVKVYYTSYSGPCAYAAAMADTAKAAGIEIFTIGYGIGSGDDCSNDDGAWDGHNAVDLMNYVATDSDHVFIEPTTADLQPIFEVIGSQLAGGSRLVE